jgi:endonuclease III
MSTRAAAAREAAFLESGLKQDKKVLSGSIVVLESSKHVGRKKSVARGSLRKRRPPVRGTGLVTGDIASKVDGSILEEDGRAEQAALPNMDRTESSIAMKDDESLIEKAFWTGPTKKRKAAPSKNKKDSALAAEPVKGGWGELPHNMGKVGGGTAGNETPHKNAPYVIDSRPKKRARKATFIKTEDHAENDDTKENSNGYQVTSDNGKMKKPPAKRNARGKAKAAQPVTPESSDHTDLDPITQELKEEIQGEYKEDTKKTGLQDSGDAKDEKPKKKRASRPKKVDVSSDIQQKVCELLDATDKPAKKIKKGKANPYGLTPGQSPFPNFIMPTIEACKQVEDALSEVHGKVEAPKEIPAPSLEVTGCGEVPSVLDALIRTRLSASTTSQNAKYAFTGLVERYGVLEKGIGAGSVDWNKVRESDVLDIEKAIKKGGLAKTKSTSIKKILEMVYEQNLARRDAFIKEKQDGTVSGVVGAEKMTQGQKDMEIDVGNKKILSLDFMHGLTADEAMMEFVKYPGIGVKTASCVILFCLQRPSFAVDTHVWRFCKWLKWVPEGATRDQTFSHCEVRIPNEMKYSLHQLFIRHGKTCGRCRAITGEGSEGWESTVCPLEHLVERTGKRKATGPPKKPAASNKAAKGKKAKKFDEEEGDDDEDVEMSDLTDIEELELDDNDEEEGVEAESSLSEDEE